jgi:hypothetical protein
MFTGFYWIFNLKKFKKDYKKEPKLIYMTAKRLFNIIVIFIKNSHGIMDCQSWIQEKEFNKQFLKFWILSKINKCTIKFVQFILIK